MEIDSVRKKILECGKYSYYKLDIDYDKIRSLLYSNNAMVLRLTCMSSDKLPIILDLSDTPKFITRIIFNDNNPSFKGYNTYNIVEIINIPHWITWLEFKVHIKGLKRIEYPMNLEVLSSEYDIFSNEDIVSIFYNLPPKLQILNINSDLMYDTNLLLQCLPDNIEECYCSINPILKYTSSTWFPSNLKFIRMKFTESYFHNNFEYIFDFTEKRFKNLDLQIVIFHGVCGYANREIINIHIDSSIKTIKWICKKIKTNEKYVAAGQMVKDMICCADRKDLPCPLYFANTECITVKCNNTSGILLNSEIVIERL